MELDFAMFAVGAEIGASGKMHIFGGGFDTMVVSELPGAIAPFYIIARFVEYDVVGTVIHKLALLGVNPDDEETVLLPELDFQVKEATTAGRRTSNAMVTIQVGLNARVPGKHQFILQVDGKEMKRLDLWISVPEAGDSEDV